jgi:hypothetical protein
MSTSRQLAAIIVTDIIGYPPLMGEDERRHLIFCERTSNFKIVTVNANSHTVQFIKPLFL